MQKAGFLITRLIYAKGRFLHDAAHYDFVFQGCFAFKGKKKNARVGKLNCLLIHVNMNMQELVS